MIMYFRCGRWGEKEKNTTKICFSSILYIRTYGFIFILPSITKDFCLNRSKTEYVHYKFSKRQEDFASKVSFGKNLIPHVSLNIWDQSYKLTVKLGCYTYDTSGMT